VGLDLAHFVNGSLFVFGLIAELLLTCACMSQEVDDHCSIVHQKSGRSYFLVLSVNKGIKLNASHQMNFTAKKGALDARLSI
jgi:hypothetical protein